MNPLKQIADNLAALNSDAPEVADAVIKLTNMAKGEPVAWVNGDDLVSDEQVKWYAKNYPSTSDMYANYLPLYAHPSRGVVDEVIRDLRETMEHCLSAADEGVDYAVSRQKLDALTTLGLMEKVGSGRWAPTEAGEAFAALQAAALPAVPVGWALVPKRPTPEMLSLALSHVYGEPFWRADAKPIGTFYSGHTAAESERANIAECGPDRVKAAYAAMLAATPAHDQPEGSDNE